jgi:O-6-methylguanine DNA methyltransferase
MKKSTTKTSLFTERVKSVVRGIKKGQVMTYKEVAHRAGSPYAYRAVGSIMSENYDTTVPCHRVVKTDGSLGGYNRGGIQKKKKILTSEGVKFSGMKVDRLHL